MRNRQLMLYVSSSSSFFGGEGRGVYKLVVFDIENQHIYYILIHIQTNIFLVNIYVFFLLQIPYYELYIIHCALCITHISSLLGRRVPNSLILASMKSLRAFSTEICHNLKMHHLKSGFKYVLY